MRKTVIKIKKLTHCAAKSLFIFGFLILSFKRLTKSIKNGRVIIFIVFYARRQHTHFTVRKHTEKLHVDSKI